MSLHNLWINPCRQCRHDVARPTPAAYSRQEQPVFAVVCRIDAGGCGHVGPLALGEGGAIDAWNAVTLPHWMGEFA